jgi:hypothetical protein
MEELKEENRQLYDPVLEVIKEQINIDRRLEFLNFVEVKFIVSYRDCIKNKVAS